MSAAIGAALAGARTMTATSSQGLALMAEVVYIAASMRAPIVMALGNRALSGPDQHPLRPLRLDADPRLRRHPALRRERAGGVRPDRASRRGSPSIRTCCCRCSSARTASRSRTRPSRSSCCRTTTVARFVGEYRIPHAVLDVARPTTQGPFAMPDYYYEFRRQQAAAIERAAAVLDRARGRVRAADRTAARRESRSTASTDAVDRDRRARLHRRNDQGRRRRPARRRRAGRPPEDRLVPALPRGGCRGRARGTSPPWSCSIAPTRPAARRRCTPRSLLRSTAAAASSRGSVYGLGGRDLHPEDIRAVFAGAGLSHIGLRGAACRV